MRKPGRSVRQWYSATVERHDGVIVLDLAKGCRRIVVVIPANSNEQIHETSTYDPSRRLFASKGDQLLIVGPGADDQAVAEVIDITQTEHTYKVAAVVKAGQVEHNKVQVWKYRTGRRAA